jgi:hypothetical protein
VNRLFDPIGARLDNWSESVHASLDEYTDIFEEIHEEHGGVKIPPLANLMYKLVMSAVYFHITKIAVEQEMSKAGSSVATDEMKHRASQTADKMAPNIFNQVMNQMSSSASSNGGGNGAMGGGLASLFSGAANAAAATAATSGGRMGDMSSFVPSSSAGMSAATGSAATATTATTTSAASATGSNTSSSTSSSPKLNGPPAIMNNILSQLQKKTQGQNQSQATTGTAAGPKRSIVLNNIM